MNALVTERNAHEDGVHHFYAEASELQLPPGDFPNELSTTLGNKQPFLKTQNRWDAGHLVAVNYAQSNGCCTLTIFND